MSDHATESLAFIRTTMARSAGFTSVPGWGGALMGSIGIAAAVVSSGQPPAVWLRIWIGAAVVATAIGIDAIRRKAHSAGQPLWSQTGRRFAQALVPALAAAATLTTAAVFGGGVDGGIDRLPGMWLLLYGAGILAGASASIRILTVLGATFMALGAITLALPASWGTFCLGAGFGALQIIFGLIIARKHGG